MITLKRYPQEIKKPTINPLTGKFIHVIMVVSKNGIRIYQISPGKRVRFFMLKIYRHSSIGRMSVSKTKDAGSSPAAYAIY